MRTTALLAVAALLACCARAGRDDQSFVVDVLGYYDRCAKATPSQSLTVTAGQCFNLANHSRTVTVPVRLRKVTLTTYKSATGCRGPSVARLMSLDSCAVDDAQRLQIRVSKSAPVPPPPRAGRVSRMEYSDASCKVANGGIRTARLDECFSWGGRMPSLVHQEMAGGASAFTLRFNNRGTMCSPRPDNAWGIALDSCVVMPGGRGSTWFTNATDPHWPATEQSSSSEEESSEDEESSSEHHELGQFVAYRTYSGTCESNRQTGPTNYVRLEQCVTRTGSYSYLIHKESRYSASPFSLHAFYSGRGCVGTPSAITSLNMNSCDWLPGVAGGRFWFTDINSQHWPAQSTSSSSDEEDSSEDEESSSEHHELGQYVAYRTYSGTCESNRQTGPTSYVRLEQCVTRTPSYSYLIHKESRYSASPYSLHVFYYNRGCAGTPSAITSLNMNDCGWLYGVAGGRLWFTDINNQHWPAQSTSSSSDEEESSEDEESSSEAPVVGNINVRAWSRRDVCSPRAMPKVVLRGISLHQCFRLQQDKWAMIAYQAERWLTYRFVLFNQECIHGRMENVTVFKGPGCVMVGGYSVEVTGLKFPVEPSSSEESEDSSEEDESSSSEQPSKRDTHIFVFFNNSALCTMSGSRTVLAEPGECVQASSRKWVSFRPATPGLYNTRIVNTYGDPQCRRPTMVHTVAYRYCNSLGEDLSLTLKKLGF